MRPAPDSRGIRRCEIERADVQRQVHQQLLAPLVGEEVDDAVERLVGAVGVQRRQHEVARLGELDAVLHGLAVADFADEDDVRRLAQGVLERVMPRFGVHADFAVRDHAALVLVHVLDRVFDGDDVAARLLVAIADHRGERGRFARAGAADQDHEAALGQHDLLQDRRQVELLEGRDLGVDQADDAADGALLHEGAHAEAADARRRDREIAFLGGVEFLGLPVVHDRAHQRGGLLGGQRALALRADFAVDLDGRRKARGDEEVGRLLLGDPTQQVLHELDGLFAIHG